MPDQALDPYQALRIKSFGPEHQSHSFNPREVHFSTIYQNKQEDNSNTSIIDALLTLEAEVIQ